MAERAPSLPFLNSLEKVPDSYGLLFPRSIKTLLNNHRKYADRPLYAQKGPLVLALQGDPGVGKTTLSGEILAYATHLNIDPIYYVSYEDSQQASKSDELGPLVPADRLPGTHTDEDYAHTNSVFFRASRLAIAAARRPQAHGLVVIETTGLGNRGTSAIERLCWRDTPNLRMDLNQQAYMFKLLWLQMNADVKSVSDHIRSHFNGISVDRLQILRSNRTRVLIDNNQDPHIGGAGDRAKEAYFRTASWQLAHLDEGPIVVPNRELLERDPEVLAASLERRNEVMNKVYIPFVCENRWFMYPIDVGVFHNRQVLRQVTLHQGLINRYNFVLQLVREGQLAQLYPYNDEETDLRQF